MLELYSERRNVWSDTWIEEVLALTKYTQVRVMIL